MPRYEFIEGSSSKFWEIELSGRSVTTRYGRIGTAGRSSVKKWPTPARARVEYEKRIAEKAKKGYLPAVGARGAPSEEGDAASSEEFDEALGELRSKIVDYEGQLRDLEEILGGLRSYDFDEPTVAKLTAALEPDYVDQLFERKVKDAVRSGELTSVAGLGPMLRREDARFVRALTPRLEEYLEAEAAAEREWSTWTMNDRVDAAFEELNAAGIVALQNAGYTISNGWEDVAAAAKRTSRGGCFYHAQDLARALRGEGLTLAFGAIPRSDEADTAIGTEVVATMARHGVETSWSGAANDRIETQSFEWKRRRFSPRPPPPAARKRTTRTR